MIDRWRRGGKHESNAVRASLARKPPDATLTAWRVDITAMAAGARRWLDEVAPTGSTRFEVKNATPWTNRWALLDRM